MSSKRPTPSTSAKRRSFDADFKRQAVGLARQLGFRQAASDLGVSEGNLRNWAATVDRLGNQAFLPTSVRTDVSAELRRAQEEIRILKMERDILKKAAALFARNPG